MTTKYGDYPAEELEISLQDERGRAFAKTRPHTHEDIVAEYAERTTQLYHAISSGKLSARGLLAAIAGKSIDPLSATIVARAMEQAGYLLYAGDLREYVRKNVSEEAREWLYEIEHYGEGE